VSFILEAGQTFGLVGESGCGKSTLARSIIRVLPPNSEIVGGQILFRGKDLLPLREREMRKIRWKEICLIFQSALNSLDPVYTVEDQIVEAIRTHERVSIRAARVRVGDLFRLVGLDPTRARIYPHQMSGGMRQRAIIAMALSLRPSIIIADEPTTALDVMVQNQVLSRFRELQRESGTTVLFITHDVGVIVAMCDRVAIMYAGALVETGNTQQVFTAPRHPYTQGLIRAFPRLHGPKCTLLSIPGAPPVISGPVVGCRFRFRCPYRERVCEEREPDLLSVELDQAAACHLSGGVTAVAEAGQTEAVWLAFESAYERGH
jgi:peptide/nickel transport system ATP-binding protein